MELCEVCGKVVLVCPSYKPSARVVRCACVLLMLHSVLLEFQHIALGVVVVWPNAFCLACRWHALINDRLSLLGRYGLCLTCSGGPISFSLGLSLLMRGWCVARVERVLAYMACVGVRCPYIAHPMTVQ